MALINVLTRFTLTDGNGRQSVFEPGITEVADDLVDHWYVAAHSEPVPVVEGEAPKRGRKPRKTAEDQAIADQTAAQQPSVDEQQAAELAEALRIAAEQSGEV